MNNSPNSIEREALDASLNRKERRHCFEQLGIDFRGRQPDSDGEVSNLRLPPSIHDDTNASVSINLDSGLVFDHGGDYEGDLYQFVQDAKGCTFQKALRWVADASEYHASNSNGSESARRPAPAEKHQSDQAPDWNPSRDGREEAVYEYRDEEGNVTCEVVRLELREDFPRYDEVPPAKRKTFLQRRHAPDHPKANDRGFVWGLDGQKPPLYRLPAVQKAVAEGESVLVVEGEKDVHTLEEWELTGTTAPMGAKKWQEAHSEVLTDANVVIVPDNDGAGEEHAQSVAESLDGLAQSVRIVQLPGLSDGEDVTDWKERGGTRADFLERVEETPPYETEDSSIPPLDKPADPLSPEDAAPIPEMVYGQLPPLLGEAAGLLNQRHERDVFLTGVLPLLSGCMPNVRGYYGHNPKPLSPNLYTCIVAGAASGKGALRWSKKITNRVDEHLRERSERERQDWEAEQERADDDGETPALGPKPPKQSLVLPSDMSAAGFHQALAARHGRAVVFGTEIDRLVNALSQEWGKIDAALREAYEHEALSYLRKTEETRICDPELSLVLSGTPAQFRALIPSTENGLFSRMALYYFEAPGQWIDQRPTQNGRKKPERFEQLAEKVKDLYLKLGRREKPLWFEMEGRHWDQHANTFAPMRRRLYTCGAGHLKSVVRRAGVTAFRATMTLCVLRAFERGDRLDTAHRLAASDADVDAGLTLACTWADHALRFARTLPCQPSPDERTGRAVRLLDCLPAEFSNKEVYAVAEDMSLDVSERTLRRDLDKASQKGLVRERKKSHWRKVGSPSA